MRDKPKNCLGCSTAICKTNRWCRDCHPVCADCGTDIGIRAIRCRSCTVEWRKRDPEYRRRASDAMKAAHKRGAYVNRYTEEYRRGLSETSKAAWERGVYGEEWRLQNSEAMKRHWREGVFDNRASHAAAMRRYWADPEWKARVSVAISKSKLRPDRVEAFRQRIKEMWEDPEFREQHTGENHAAWRGGGKESWCASYPKEFDRALRLSIRDRDGFCCVLCGKSENGRPHDCHHIDYNTQNSSPSNLVTLCRPCHSKTNRNRDAYRIGFQALFVDNEPAEVAR